MDMQRIEKLIKVFQTTGNTQGELEFLKKEYAIQPSNPYLEKRLMALDELTDPLLFKNPKEIFEFKWREGFGATIHTIMTRMEYCLQHQYYFTFVEPLGFGHWTTYFKPFWHAGHKTRMYDKVKEISKKEPRLPIYKDHVKGYQQKNGSNLFFKNDYKFMLDTIYNYQDNIQEKVEAMIKQLNLPEKYSCIHIRRGDRQLHKRCPCKVQVDSYVEAIRKLNPNLGVLFVASDDVKMIEAIAKHFPNVQSLTQVAQNGFHDKTFFQSSHQDKADHMLQLFAEIEIAVRSEYFVGTYCSVLSHLMQARRGLEKSVLLYD